MYVFMQSQNFVINPSTQIDNWMQLTEQKTNLITSVGLFSMFKEKEKRNGLGLWCNFMSSIMTKRLTAWPPVCTSVSLFICDVNGRWPAYL